MLPGLSIYDSDSSHDDSNSTKDDSNSSVNDSDSSVNESTPVKQCIDSTPVNQSNESIPSLPTNLFNTKVSLKKRSIPHIDGNYATHIYIKVINHDLFKDIIDYIQDKITKHTDKVINHSDKVINHTDKVTNHSKRRKVNHSIHSKQSLIIPCESLIIPCDLPLHTSLSRPIYLIKDQIKPLVNHLTHSISLKPFLLRYSKSKLFYNDDHTRLFLSICVLPSAHLHTLTRIVDSILVTINQPPFYTPPEWHVSICWEVVDDQINNAMTEDILESEVMKGFERELRARPEMVETVTIKCGNRVFDVGLKG